MVILGGGQFLKTSLSSKHTQVKTYLHCMWALPMMTETAPPSGKGADAVYDSCGLPALIDLIGGCEYVRVCVSIWGGGALFAHFA